MIYEQLNLKNAVVRYQINENLGNYFFMRLVQLEAAENEVKRGEGSGLKTLPFFLADKRK